MNDVISLEIDDFLPVDESGSLLCAYMDPINDYWAALIEKAVRADIIARLLLNSAKAHSCFDFASS